MRVAPENAPYNVNVPGCCLYIDAMCRVQGAKTVLVLHEFLHTLNGALPRVGVQQTPPASEQSVANKLSFAQKIRTLLHFCCENPLRAGRGTMPGLPPPTALTTLTDPPRTSWSG